MRLVRVRLARRKVERSLGFGELAGGATVALQRIRGGLLVGDPVRLIAQEAKVANHALDRLGIVVPEQTPGAGVQARLFLGAVLLRAWLSERRATLLSTRH